MFLIYFQLWARSRKIPGGGSFNIRGAMHPSVVLVLGCLLLRLQSQSTSLRTLHAEHRIIGDGGENIAPVPIEEPQRIIPRLV